MDLSVGSETPHHQNLLSIATCPARDFSAEGSRAGEPPLKPKKIDPKEQDAYDVALNRN
jgi:hypothetical protein